nr:MAG TPA: hypothetical protein [Caudoviricetes sp.]
MFFLFTKKYINFMVSTCENEKNVRKCLKYVKHLTMFSR